MKAVCSSLDEWPSRMALARPLETRSLQIVLYVSFDLFELLSLECQFIRRRIGQGYFSFAAPMCSLRYDDGAVVVTREKQAWSIFKVAFLGTN
jgi:hypothetical protein